MSAMNGSLVPARTRGRLFGCVALVMALSAMVFASVASAKTAPITHTYLALGDSLAFGYSQQLYNENEKSGDPVAAFEHGYANDYFAKMAPKKNGVQLTNDGCPGETSSSLIGDGPLGAALAASPFKVSEEAPCAYQEAWNAYHTDGEGGPLHNPYVGESQLENALKEIAVDHYTGKPVVSVSLDIGPNDELAAVHGCETEVGTEFVTEGKSKYGSTPTEAVEHCIVDHVPGLIEKLVKNIGATIYTLREGAAFGGVNYAGQICYVGAYDPYGSVFKAGEEELAGSRFLATTINQDVNEKAVEPFGAEYANALTKFNPGNRSEPVRLREWTNMANTMEFEGKKDGPDIHATPAGYRELAKIMRTEGCTPAI
ncbi:MAG TPA: hypothetical protein VK778_05605 [Solirubrobacteraceae bacterium]|jgi:hypothetical protein|nr:hypothetical protein [Solirubrobacteraceae bacterium]